MSWPWRLGDRPPTSLSLSFSASISLSSLCSESEIGPDRLSLFLCVSSKPPDLCIHLPRHGSIPHQNLYNTEVTIISVIGIADNDNNITRSPVERESATMSLRS
ncbi:hypothetical protein TIFTF001_047879 [Ficus carica]|uniref:Uncharacterized protein n=1 Tax=Ficus carica TaxID=3494 RepID=A0AA87ZKH9_FICCA|nr:hypothetical protein TIFTF001_047873 [Ficus carica]GMN28060.1 hypothetical protein TIFTF001_047875 [Ficus carica]GMN28115.1 hypothetical protein TIFTF001_047877 [Ficus carica]GMN28168.1 hypothetical protein TIFTF001_047879 [Ficus carica]